MTLDIAPKGERAKLCCALLRGFLIFEYSMKPKERYLTMLKLLTNGRNRSHPIIRYQLIKPFTNCHKYGCWSKRLKEMMD